MQLISPEYWAIFLSNIFYSGFTFFCIICLLGRIITSKKVKEEFINIHVAVNLSLAMGAVVAVISLASEFYTAYHETSEYEDFAFIKTDFNFFVFSMITTTAGWLASLLFFIKKLRSSWVLSTAVLILWNSGMLLSWIVRLWKANYLPSAWETDDNNFLLIGLQVLLFGVIVFLVYLLLNKRKKLPYLSAWMR